MRASILSFVVTLALIVGVEKALAEVCPGDCTGNGALTASDFGRMQSLLSRCGPCNGRPGAVAAGCASLIGGCPSADLNDDGCFTAAELSFILRRSAGLPDPTQPGKCRVDKASFPGNKPKVLACDCNANGAVTASDLGRLIRLTRVCTTCADGSPGAPAAGCSNAPGCPAADPDGDGCIRPGDVNRLCGVRVQ